MTSPNFTLGTGPQTGAPSRPAFPRRRLRLSRANVGAQVAAAGELKRARGARKFGALRGFLGIWRNPLGASWRNGHARHGPRKRWDAAILNLSQ